MRKVIKYLFYIVCLLCLFYIIYFRFQESMNRGFSRDEYTHLHATFLLTHGKLPFKDFFFLYTPIFHLTLFPLFKILGDSYLVLTASRMLVFIYFLISLAFTFGISFILGNSLTGLVATLVAAAMPMSIEKALEIRPDNLMLPLMLGGIFLFLKGLRSNPKRNFFWAGFLSALSFLVLVKSIFTVGAFFISVLYFLFFRKNMERKITLGIKWFLFGGGVVTFLFLAGLWTFGLFKEAFLSLVIYPKVVLSSLRFGTELNPFFWFRPNDAVFGTYKGLAWQVNSLILVFLFLGIFTSLLRLKKEKRIAWRFLLFLPLLVSFAYLFLVLRPYHQYLLPFLAFVPFWVAFFFEDINFFFRNVPFSGPFLTIIFLLILAASISDSWQVKKRWFDAQDRQFIKYVLTNTSPTDVFWGGEGSYVFRQDGYYVFTGAFVEYPSSMLRRLPPFIPQLEERKTKYLLISTSALLNRAWPFDQWEMKAFVDWVKENFRQTDYPDLWVRRER